MGYYCNKCKEDITQGEFDYSMKHYSRPLCRDCQEEEPEETNNRPKRKATPHAKKLYDALIKKGIKCELEGDDGYKSVDIVIEWADLHIEVDGKHHIFNPKQLYTDIERSAYSHEGGYDTIHISNEDIDNDLNGVANAIAKVARKRYNEF